MTTDAYRNDDESIEVDWFAARVCALTRGREYRLITLMISRVKLGPRYRLLAQCDQQIRGRLTDRSRTIWTGGHQP